MPRITTKTTDTKFKQGDIVKSIIKRGSFEYGGKVTDVPFESQGVISKVDKDGYIVVFECNNSNWSVTEKEIVLVSKFDAKAYMRRELRLKRIEEAKVAKAMKLKSKFKVGMFCKFSKPDVLKNSHGDSVVRLYARDHVCMVIDNLKNEKATKVQIKTLVGGLIGQTSDTRMTQDISCLEILRPLKRPSKGSRLFKPVEYFKNKIYTFEQQVERIKKMKLVKSVKIKDNGDSKKVTIETEEIIVKYYDKKYNIGSYIFHFSTKAKYYFRVKHVQGGFSDSDGYNRGSPFMESSADNGFTGFCLGTSNQPFKTATKEEDILESVRIVLGGLKSTSETGYFGIQTWVKFLERAGREVK